MFRNASGHRINPIEAVYLQRIPETGPVMKQNAGKFCFTGEQACGVSLEIGNQESEIGNQKSDFCNRYLKLKTKANGLISDF